VQLCHLYGVIGWLSGIQQRNCCV